jgi:hypothetical protein
LALILACPLPIRTGTMQGVSTASPSSSGKPGPPGKPPRSALSMRDLLGAVALLVVVVLAFAGLTRSCSFAPGGPTTDPSAGPTVDAPTQLRALAATTPFALRVPAVPAGWRANAVDTMRVGPAAHLSVRTGYVTPAGRYMRLDQSDADEAELVMAEAEEAGAAPRPERTASVSRPSDEGARLVASGTVDVAGTNWVTYTDGTPEPIRVADVDGVRLLITGSGGDDEFRTLAAATTSGEVLPH